jgi:hypothetical protein
MEGTMGDGGAAMIALKEWAVAVQAILDGRQTLLLRKGGIEEETRDFEIKSRMFFFYPTFEHQKKELLKPENKQGIDLTLENWSPGQTVLNIEGYAEVIDDLEITSQDELRRIAPFHIWTDTFAEERLRWKRMSPLHLLIVRAYRLPAPIQIRIQEEYLGCKSWLDIGSLPRQPDGIPVLTDQEFQKRRESIRKEVQ